jgi:DNA-binding SARP family transcriptional activator
MRREAPVPQVELRVLGGFQLLRGGQPVDVPGAARQLLAFLATAQTSSGQRAHVAGSIWPEIPEERALGRLRTALWQLSRAGLAPLDHDRQSVRLASAVRVDLDEAKDVARRLIRAGEDASPADCRCRLLYRDILPDWYDDWLVMARERHLDPRLHALEIACERLAALGWYGEATQAGLAAVAAEPLRESSHRSLIRAYLAEGNAIVALRQFERFQEHARRELGADPSEQMASLVRDIYVGVRHEHEMAS